MAILELYHGSEWVVEHPSLALARPHNDYGPGFYTTPDLELACEWACQRRRDGYANRYALQDDGLVVLDLLDGTHTVLEWIALLLAHRLFSLNSGIALSAREELVTRFLPSLAGVDVVVGYRADDSYFSYARSFVENGLPLGKLAEALYLGELGEQTVLVSERAFSQLSYQGVMRASSSTYYPRYLQRDNRARASWREAMNAAGSYRDDLFLMDILRGEVSDNELRLRTLVSR